MAEGHSSEQRAFWDIPILKRCPRCKERKSLTEFYPDTRPSHARKWKQKGKGGHGVRSECIACCKRLDKVRSGTPKEKARKRNSKLQRYGMTLAEYEARVAAQGGKCAICGNAEKRRDKWTGQVLSLSVDHDHRTGMARGVVCHNCNVAIGYFEDDPERMRRAIVYLEKYHGPTGPAV